MKKLFLTFSILATFLCFSQTKTNELSISFFEDFRPKSVPFRMLFIKPTYVFGKDGKRMNSLVSFEMMSRMKWQYNFSLQYGLRFKLIQKKINLNYSFGVGPYYFTTYYEPELPRSYMVGGLLNNSLELGKQFDKFGFFVGFNASIGLGYFEEYQTWKTYIGLGGDYHMNPFIKLVYKLN